MAYGVKSFKFIGGAYGRSNERTIMEELYKNGPVVLNFEPSFDFLYYSEGIYHSAEAADWILEGKKKPEWVELLICIVYRKKLIIRYYAMVGVKRMERSIGYFRIVGAKVGERKVDFGISYNLLLIDRMRRGTDESAIESMAEAAEPVVYNLSRHKKHKGVNQSLSEISTGFDQDEMN